MERNKKRALTGASWSPPPLQKGWRRWRQKGECENRDSSRNLCPPCISMRLHAQRMCVKQIIAEVFIIQYIIM